MPPPVNQQLGERRAGLRKREKADETRQSKPILSFKYSYSSGGDDLSGDGGSGQASQKAEELASESKRNDASMCEEELPPRRGVLQTYMWWVVGGWFGLHHIYLGREEQAFLWSTSFGLGLMGWVRDIWRIPDYVAAANGDLKFEEAHVMLNGPDTERPDARPPLLFNMTMIMSFFIAVGYRYVAIHALPAVAEDRLQSFDTLVLLVASLTTGLVVWVVNTMPFRRTGSLRKSIEGAAIGEILQYIKRDHDNADIDTDSHKDEWMVGALGVLLSIIWFQRSRGYLALGDNLKKARKRRGCCRTYFRVTAAVMVVFLHLITHFIVLAVFSNVYYNVSIDDDDGVPHRVKDKVQNILNSPEWAHVSAAAGQRWQSWKDGGWEKVSSDFAALCDIDGSKRAFVDLELTGDASQEEIKEAAHRLRKLYHPDKCSLPPDECVTKFQAVQNAYELLNDRAKSRANSNDIGRKKRKRKSRAERQAQQ